MKPDKGNTTPEDFELFKGECLKWIDYFGLKDWHIQFEHGELGDCYAECRINGLSNRNVVMAFNVQMSEADKKLLDIKRTAFHEVWELILWPMEYIGACRYTQPEDMVQERHSIIRRMENTVYKSLVV